MSQEKKASVTVLLPAGRLPLEVMDKAHSLGLKVHAYTFRKDQHPNFKNFDDLLEFGFYDIDLDGGFTDFPDKVVSFLKR